MNKSYVFLFCLFLILNVKHGFSQEKFRRHFIICYDASTVFINNERNNPNIRIALEDLFLNQKVGNLNGNQSILFKEKEQEKKFFDSKKDEISFYYFNLSDNEISALKAEKDTAEIVRRFPELYLKNTNINWTTFKSQNITPNIIDYLYNTLNFTKSPADISMPNMVYPLILEAVNQNKYFEEVILVILTRGIPTRFNAEDRITLKQAIGINDAVLKSINNQLELLSGNFEKSDYFYFSYNDNSGIPNGIYGFQVTPKNVKPASLLTTIALDSDFKIAQESYGSSLFTTSPILLRFPNNKSLAPVEVKLAIYGVNNDGNTEIFNDIIASKLDKNIWSSGYSSSGKLMKFNKRNNSYTIPRLKFDLSSLNTSQYKNLTYKIELKTQSKTSEMGSLNYLFNTTSTFPITNVNYTGLNEYLILYFIIPFILLLILIVFLLFYGKPQRINLVLNGYIDSYEITDYKSFGKLITPYKSWNSDNQKVDYLLVNGGIGYRSSSFLFNWNSPIFIKLFDVSVPDGFEIFIKYKTDDIKEFGIDRRIPLKKDRNNNFSFFIGIRQNNITRRLTNPELFRFKIHASYVQSKVLIRTNLEELIDYKFHLGNDLGDVWVGFDPGTTGSCVAVGSDTNNIVLIEDIRIKGANNPLRRIIPSVVGFDKDQNIELGEIINDSQFIYGNLAYTRRLEESKYDLHYSLKKLLGYKDVKRIVFKNGKTIDLQGKDLAKLLVRGLFKDMTSYFNQNDVSADEYRRKEIFNPLRAVVAIPNNSTISKVQDMIDCIANLNQFKEIRYVYEAEAVLFYYLSNFSKLSNGSTISDSETILVFDMGGATINATIVTSNKIFIDNRPKYSIDFLGKIGYGIGGDTIDYCISRFILSNSTEFPALGGINIFDKKIQLAELAFQVKKEIIANFYSNKDYLITAFNLETYINKALDVSIKINEETSKMYKYFRKDSESYKLFTHQLFTKTIYKNVKEAVNEVIHLSNNVAIDKVIFSGRSTSFPFIKETVQNELKANKGKNEVITLDLEESKVAVAKGACWYGINKNSVFLNNLKTNASFGFKKTLSVNQADVEFHELIEIGNAFDTNNDGIDSFKGKEKICDDFAFDGGKVNFYQIMGKDADKILSNGEKHKFSKIATIMPDKVTSEIAMEVSENDEVTCFVRLNNGQIIKESGVVSDQEIEDANEEHYTWIVK